MSEDDLIYCDSCGHIILSDYDVGRCNKCKKTLCATCARKCDECGKTFCRECLIKCKECSVWVCEACLAENHEPVQCAICGEPFCSEWRYEWLLGCICLHCVKNPPPQYSQGRCIRLGHGEYNAGYCTQCERLYFADGTSKGHNDGGQNTLDEWLKVPNPQLN